MIPSMIYLFLSVVFDFLFDIICSNNSRIISFIIDSSRTILDGTFTLICENISSMIPSIIDLSTILAIGIFDIISSINLSMIPSIIDLSRTSPGGPPVCPPVGPPVGGGSGIDLDFFNKLYNPSSKFFSGSFTNSLSILKIVNSKYGFAFSKFSKFLKF